MGDRLEVHTHSFVRGPRAYKSWLSNIEHSHEGGDAQHSHPDTGPASYTIDKDEWFRKTGLRGGGRKKFTKRPSGEQFPLVPIDPEEMAYDVIVHPSAQRVAEEMGVEGAGMHPIHRLALGAKVHPRAVIATDDGEDSRG